MTCLETIRQAKLFNKTTVDAEARHNPKLLTEAATKLQKMQAIVKAKRQANGQ